MEPLVVDCGLLLDDLGNSSTAHRSHWSVGLCSRLRHPLSCCRWEVAAQQSWECLGSYCLPVVVSWPKATCLFVPKDHNADMSSRFPPGISGQTESSGFGVRQPCWLWPRYSANGDKNVPTLWGCEDCTSCVGRALNKQVGMAAHWYFPSGHCLSDFYFKLFTPMRQNRTHICPFLSRGKGNRFYIQISTMHCEGFEKGDGDVCQEGYHLSQREGMEAGLPLQAQVGAQGLYARWCWAVAVDISVGTLIMETVLKEMENETCHDWCRSVDWALSYGLKGRWFNSQSGHSLGLQARPLIGGVWEATNQCISHTFMFLSLFSLPPFPSL